jgi:hypothetical protein
MLLRLSSSPSIKLAVNFGAAKIEGNHKAGETRQKVLEWAKGELSKLCANGNSSKQILSQARLDPSTPDQFTSDAEFELEIPSHTCYVFRIESRFDDPHRSYIILKTSDSLENQVHVLFRSLPVPAASTEKDDFHFFSSEQSLNPQTALCDLVIPDHKISYLKADCAVYNFVTVMENDDLCRECFLLHPTMTMKEAMTVYSAGNSHRLRDRKVEWLHGGKCSPVAIDKGERLDRFANLDPFLVSPKSPKERQFVFRYIGETVVLRLSQDKARVKDVAENPKFKGKGRVVFRIGAEYLQPGANFFDTEPDAYIWVEKTYFFELRFDQEFQPKPEQVSKLHDFKVDPLEFMNLTDLTYRIGMVLGIEKFVLRHGDHLLDHRNQLIWSVAELTAEQKMPIVIARCVEKKLKEAPVAITSPAEESVAPVEPVKEVKKVDSVRLPEV